jgi:hypothetical protein
MIHCRPYGGISNRMKCIISCIAEYDEINLIWKIPETGGGVRCEFNDIYKNIYKGHSSKIVNSCKFIHEEMNTLEDEEKNTLSNELKQKYLNVIKTLQPVDYILERVKEEKDKLGDFNTVSVRTFRSFEQEYESWGKFFKIENLFKIMDNLEGKILLTCDDNDVTDVIKNKYDVYTTPKRTKFGDFTTVEGMQDILIDQYLGGMAKNLYGTRMSSFSEMQWWLGLCQSNYIQMKLHEKN